MTDCGVRRVSAAWIGRRASAAARPSAAGAAPRKSGACAPHSIGLAILACLLLAAPIVAQEPAAEVAVEEEVVVDDSALDPTPAAGEQGGALNYSLVQLIEFGGWVGYVIIALSVIGVALIIDYTLLLRAAVLMPPGEVTEIRALITGGRAAELAAGEPRASFVGRVTAAGAAELAHGWAAMVKAMEDRADELTGRLLRRIEYLNMISNVAPMLGLLGTVIGMVEAFNTISVAAGGADPRLLASGIFKALMTTVMGLMVAIPAYFAFGVFRNRVDALVGDATAVAEELMEPLRPAGSTEPVIVRRHA